MLQLAQTFLGSSKPLTLTASLDSDIFQAGQPISIQYETKGLYR